MKVRAHISAPSLAVARGVARPGTRAVAEEVPVALSYNGTTQAVMMASPADLEDFAAGFTLSEEIVNDLSEIESLTIAAHPNGIEVQMWLAPGAEARLARRRRHMAGPVGCGLCGIDSLDQAIRPLPTLPDTSLSLTPAQISAAAEALRGAQALHDITRAVHAAGFFTPDAGLVAAREDVGRHNALDKLVGALARAGHEARAGALILTSRVSVEMVQKAVLAGAPVLVAVSAPTAHAIRLAEAAGLTLAALARGEMFEVFTHPHRIATARASDVA
ncbi:formate dehydrogenase [Rhodovulum sp. NI22]|nr:formate dehydrogenase [Rhodovulum sp. NI22]